MAGVRTPRVFYYTDSGEPQSRVRAFSFDLPSGQLAGERDLITFAPDDGMADGLVVDAEGCLWIAMWDGGCVRRYSPHGELLGRYPLPVSEPTCPGFGGPDLDELVCHHGLGRAAADQVATPSRWLVICYAPGPACAG